LAVYGIPVDVFFIPILAFLFAEKIVSEGASFSVVITSRRSFSFRIFSEVGILTVPSRHKREITNLG